MWYVKKFKTQQELDSFIEKNKKKLQIDIIYMNNGYACEYRYKTIIY
jgi:hypothetical protein